MHDNASDAARGKWVPHRPLDTAPPGPYWSAAADSRIDSRPNTTDDTPELFDDRTTRPGVPAMETPADASLSIDAEVTDDAP